MKIFKPTRDNLHPKIIEFFEKNEKWHEETGHKLRLSIDELLKVCSGWDNGTFTVLILDSGKTHHGNFAIRVFNKDGVLVDARIYFNPIEGHKVPKKAFIGTPIIDGSKPMKFKPAKKKDKPFQPPV
jgi:hypothetical protein